MAEKTKKITSIGGSALIEGIMMRGPKKTMVAVRTGEDSVYTEELKFESLSSKYKFLKTPFIRGLAGFIDSMRLSYKALAISADKAIDGIDEDDEEPSKFEKWIERKFGDKFLSVLMGAAMVIGVIFAVLLFFVLPSALFNLLSVPFPSLMEMTVVRSIFEGVLRIVIFLAYIILCSRMEEMKRVFQYHGAEHKTIFCYENEEELTVENVKKQSRFHPRCGTSFMVIMLLIGIVIGLFIPATNPIIRGAIKILLLPVVCGIGYEVLKICGKYDNKLIRIISAPGMWAQRITTKEPDDTMIEVAIEAMTPVIPEDGTDIVSVKEGRLKKEKGLA